ncbi:MAG TPA: 3-dehydroquinate synthase [Porphyromonadaceae bacterium]|nr:3-dehydroquinate synthase [Porphyromonadaceae bacterium]
MQPIFISNLLEEKIEEVLNGLPYDKAFILVDSHTEDLCLPLFLPIFHREAKVITIGSGEESKNLHTLEEVWRELSNGGATRSSLLLNLGGGMVTDLGGFAASTFKRGIRFINFPTTILGAVDASIGGKTGIDFNGLKNEIGAFKMANAVVIYPKFFRTLSMKDKLSGFAEMLKHSLLDSEEQLSKHLNYTFQEEEEEVLEELLKFSIHKKEYFVEKDPLEVKERKALNLGHTIGHAVESLLLKHNTPVFHGYAVAWGIVSELYLSHAKVGFPSLLLSRIAKHIRNTWGNCPITCQDYEELFSLMKHDKKNVNHNEVNFTLLSSPGEIHFNQTATQELIFESLDFLRDG